MSHVLSASVNAIFAATRSFVGSAMVMALNTPTSLRGSETATATRGAAFGGGNADNTTASLTFRPSNCNTGGNGSMCNRVGGGGSDDGGNVQTKSAPNHQQNHGHSRTPSFRPVSVPLTRRPTAYTSTRKGPQQRQWRCARIPRGATRLLTLESPNRTSHNPHPSNVLLRAAMFFWLLRQFIAAAATGVGEKAR